MFMAHADIGQTDQLPHVVAETVGEAADLLDIIVTALGERCVEKQGRGLEDQPALPPSLDVGRPVLLAVLRGAVGGIVLGGSVLKLAEGPLAAKRAKST
jgi:hypothetical protein